MTDDLFDPRLTEHRNPRTREIDLAGPLEIVDLINAEDRTVPEAVHAEREAIAKAIELAVESFRRGGRLIYVGAGTSGRLGVLDAAECPPTFGTDPDQVHGIIAGGYIALIRSQEGAEDQPEDGAAALSDAGVGADDFVFGIASSSTTPFVRGALERAAALGASSGLLCCTDPGEELRTLVDVCVVPLVGPEVIAGSTRMKAGTATKLVLNTISTGAMIRLGKVFENLMVDLDALSDKLRDRSVRIVMAAVSCEREEATRLIDAAGGSVKAAVIMGRTGLPAELAQLQLMESDGFVRRALERWEQSVGRSQVNPYDGFPQAPPDQRALDRVRAALRHLPRRLSSLLSGAPNERLRRRPEGGGWCAKEHVEHLILLDEYFAKRISAMLSGAAEVAERDDDRENQAVFDSGARGAPVEMLLRRLADGRAALVFRVEEIGPAELARTAIHAKYGPISVYQILRHLAWHDHHHYEAIQSLVAD